MSETKHTPGPWKVWSDEEGRFGIVDKSGFFVTFAFPIDGDGSGIVQSKNAALIAAAPDMLAALKQVEAEMQAGFGSSFGETREQVRRAIRKAEVQP